MRKKTLAILLCMAMCLPLMCFGVSAAGEENVKEVTTAEEFVQAYLELGNSGDGVILLKNDITVEKNDVQETDGATKLVAGSAENNKIVIRGSGTDTKTKLTVSTSLMFNTASGRTIEFDNIHMHSTAVNDSSQIAFNGNKVVFNNNCEFSSAVDSTDCYMGYVYLGSQGSGTASAHNATFNSGRFSLVALNGRGDVTSSASVTVQGSTYIDALTVGNKNGGKNIGTANVNVWGGALVGKLYITYATDRDGSVYVNYGSDAAGQSLIYLTGSWNSKTVTGDVVIQVDNINNNNNNKKILTGNGTVSGDTVLILNNGLDTSKFAEIGGIGSVISVPSGVYAFAEKNDDDSFAHRLKVQVKTASGYDKVVVRNGDGDVVSYSTEGTVSGNNTYYYLDLEDTLDSEYTVSLEKTTDAQFRGVQKGNDGKSVRFIGSIDTLDCEGVGLEIVCGSNKGDTSTQTVYTSVIADGKTVTAGELGSEYLFTAVVKFENTDVSGTECEFTVKAFKVVEGEKIYGTATTFKIEF